MSSPIVVNSDSDSNNSTRNSSSESESYESVYIPTRQEKARIESMEMAMALHNARHGIKTEKPRNKARRSSKISKNRSNQPHESEKKKKRKRKTSSISGNSVHGDQNSSKRSSVCDDVQIEPQSILNSSPRFKAIKFDENNTKSKNGFFGGGRSSSSNDQTYHSGGHHVTLGLNNVTKVIKKNNSGYTSESNSRSGDCDFGRSNKFDRNEKQLAVGNGANHRQRHNYDGYNSDRKVHNPVWRSDRGSSAYSSQSNAHDRSHDKMSKNFGQYQNTPNHVNKPYYPGSNDGISGRNVNNYSKETINSHDRPNQYHRNRSSPYGNTGNYNMHSREPVATSECSYYGPRVNNKNNTSVIRDVEKNGVSSGMQSNSTSNVDIIPSKVKPIMKDSSDNLTSWGATGDSPWSTKSVNSGWGTATASSWQKEPNQNTSSTWNVKQSEKKFSWNYFGST